MIPTRKRILSRHEALKAERSRGGWEDAWREVAEHILPQRAQFLSDDRNRLQRPKAINAAARLAARTLAAGMMAGITSPARPWFKLTTPNPRLAEGAEVKGWLSETEDALRLHFSRSNIYKCLHEVYSDLTFGTAAMHLEEDPEDTLRGYSFPVGRYCVAASARGRIDTIYRELSLTVAQLAQRFGVEALSPRVRALHADGRLDEVIEILHAIEPNLDHRPGLIGPKGKRYLSLWLEVAGGEETGFLRVAGWDDFPVLGPRWEAAGENAYGYGPGFDALGACKAMQKAERRKYQAIDRMVEPPMVGPASLRAQGGSLAPGAITYVDGDAAGARFTPAMVLPPGAVEVAQATVTQIREEIRSIFYADLWLMLAESDGTMTAREVAERHEEKMLQLGPVLERLQDELLDPLISLSFGILLRAGRIPPPPPELQGEELRVEYVSILAQAQKLLGVTAIERFTGFVAQLGQIKPEALDKLGTDETVDAMAEALGVPPSLNLSADRVARIREEKAKAAAQQQAIEQAGQLAQGAKALGQTPMGSDSALDRMLGVFGAAPPAQGVA